MMLFDGDKHTYRSSRIRVSQLNFTQNPVFLDAVCRDLFIAQSSTPVR